MSSTTVVIFTRVSKQSQDYSRQVADLQAYADRQQYQVLTILKEKISGSTKNAARPELHKLLELCLSGQVDKVLVAEVSRLGRRTSEVLQVVEQLSDLGISIYVQNYALETLRPDGKRNPTAQFMFTMLAEFARLEKETLVERIHSGIEQARREGKHVGRAAGSVKKEAQLLTDHADIVRQLKAGHSIRHVAKICQKAEGTVKKVKKVLEAEKTAKQA